MWKPTALKICAMASMVALAGCEGRSTALRITTKDASPDGPTITTYFVDLNPLRQLDLIFMIDNSPSMAPKQAKLRENFPRLIAALKNPIDGSLPDLRVAIIDSDLGTNGAYSSGSCGPKSLGTSTSIAVMAGLPARGLTCTGASFALLIRQPQCLRVAVCD